MSTVTAGRCTTGTAGAGLSQATWALALAMTRGEVTVRGSTGHMELALRQVCRPERV